MFYAKKSEAATMETPKSGHGPTLRDLYEQHGALNNVDPDLLQAIARVESNERAAAVRWKPPHDVSVGLMQILAIPPEGTAQGTDYFPTNKFNISPWPVSFEELKDPNLNISLGAQILAWNLRTFGFPRGVAVYNNYGARHASINGPFPNDAYVSKVLSMYHTLKGNGA